MRRVVIFNYNSKFADNIAETVRRYNLLNPEKQLAMDMYPHREIEKESDAGIADIIIHSGGKGRPVKEDVMGVPKLYICHSHEWKAVHSGGKLASLTACVKGVREVDILDDDDVLGGKGKMRIMKYHELAVVRPPVGAKVLGVSRTLDRNNNEIEIIEAIKYNDGSISVQGHPEEGAAAHIFYNLFNKVASTPLLQPA